MEITRRVYIHAKTTGRPPSLISAFWAPLFRLEDTNVMLKVTALVVSTAQFIWADAFLAAVALLFFSSLIDWQYGRVIAKRKKEYSEALSDWGWNSKGAGLALAVLLRGGEYWVAGRGQFDTLGYVATGFAMTLFLRDIRSIDKKRRCDGGPPIPFLSTALDWLESLQVAMLPKHLQEPSFGRRKHEHPETKEKE